MSKPTPSTYRPQPRPQVDPIIILRPVGVLLRELDEIMLQIEKNQRSP